MAVLYKTTICLLFLLISSPVPSASVTILACTSPATTISLTQVSETFKYPSTGSYPLLTTCEWLFQSSDANNTISFVVSKINVDCGDILRFHDGTSSSASSIGNAICCSGCTLAYKSTTGNNLYGKLSTDNTLTASETGFQVTINVGKDESSCNTTGYPNNVSLSSSITLTSPSFPKAYPPNFECTYTYTSSSGTIQIEFLYLDVEPNGSDCYDFVEIYDGSSTSSSVIKRVCGTTLPAVKYTSTGSSMTLKFSSDGYSTNLGYKAIISPVGTEESTTIIATTVSTTVGAQELYFCDTPNKDPCVVANEKAPYEPVARFANCEHTSNGFCDRYITPGWYRYNDRMLDRCPGLLRCGTFNPSWLNGSHPDAVNEEVVRTVCKVGFEGCCTSQATIKIRNCGQFMAYCLPALDTCPERYCFGTSGPCNATSSEVSTIPSIPPVEQNSTANPTSITTVLSKERTTTSKDTNTESAQEKTTEEATTKTTTKSPNLGVKDDSSSSSSSLITISIAIGATALSVSLFLVISVLIYHKRRASGHGNTTENTYERPIVAVPAVNEYDMPVTLQKEGGVYDELPSEEEYQNEAPRDNPYDVISDRAIQNNTYGK